MTGKKFKRYTVVSYSHTKNGVAMWDVVCDCGNKRVARSYDLKSGKQGSCGCLKREKIIKKFTKHGECRTPLYNRWRNMLNRCRYRKRKEAKNYILRGITVCSDWHEFLNFKRDMEEGFKPELELDRIDNNKGYYKENCRWVTREINSNNKRRSHKIKEKDKYYSIKEYCRKHGLVYNTFRQKYYKQKRPSE